MADATDSQANDPNEEESKRETLWQALQQWSSNPQGAIDLVRPLADEGDPDAIVLLAYIMMQQGRASEGLPYAKKAVDLGAAVLGPNYIGHLISTEHRQEGIDLFRRAVQAGYPADSLGQAQQVAQSGEKEAALELLRLAREHPATVPATDERMTDLLSRIEKAESRQG